MEMHRISREISQDRVILCVRAFPESISTREATHKALVEATGCSKELARVLLKTTESTIEPYLSLEEIKRFERHLEGIPECKELDPKVFSKSYAEDREAGIVPRHLASFQYQKNVSSSRGSVVDKNKSAKKRVSTEPVRSEEETGIRIFYKADDKDVLLFHLKPGIKHGNPIITKTPRTFSARFRSTSSEKEVSTDSSSSNEEVGIPVYAEVQGDNVFLFSIPSKMDHTDPDIVKNTSRTYEVKFKTR